MESIQVLLVPLDKVFFRTPFSQPIERRTNINNIEMAANFQIFDRATGMRLNGIF